MTWDDVDALIKGISKSRSNGKIDGINFNPNDKIHRGLIIYGLSLHSLADIFAHSSVAIVNNENILIKHKKYIDYNNTTTTTDDVTYSSAADNVNFIPSRNNAATLVCKNALRLISSMGENSNTSSMGYSGYLVGNLSVFNLEGTEGESYPNDFKLVNFSRYAKGVCNSTLFKNDNKYNAFFDNWNSGVFYIYGINDGYSYYNTSTGLFQSSK